MSEELQALATVFQDDLTNHLAAVRGDSDTYGYAIMLGDQSADLADAIAVSNRREDLAKFDDDYRDEAKFIPDEWQHWHHDAFPTFRERFQVLLGDFQQSSPEWKEERLLIDNLCELYLRAAEAVVDEGGFGNIYYRVIWNPIPVIRYSQNLLVGSILRKFVLPLSVFLTRIWAGNHRLQRSGGGRRFRNGQVFRRRPLNRTVIRLSSLNSSHSRRSS